MDRAIVLLSGGVDSATTLAIAIEEGLEVLALTFDYGQRSKGEIERARRVASNYEDVEQRIVGLDLSHIGGSALTDRSIDVPEEGGEGIPVTYVPARNTIFLSVALALAEVIGARAIYIGVNAIDYSGYPDCRPEFIEAFQGVADKGTKMGVEGERIEIRAPLLQMSKSEIIRKGLELGVPFEDTWSCYREVEPACGRCDSCRLRLKGFEEAGAVDPIEYEVAR